jgi:hypothetical protein
MLRSSLRTLYRGAINRLLGLDTLVEHRIAPVVRREMDAALGAILGRVLDRRLTPDLEQVACLIAAANSASYVLQHMRAVRNLVRREELLKFALGQCSLDGLVMEFGVYRGASLTFIADHEPGPVYGFDSFEGLPEDWTDVQRKGRFSLGGEAPQLGRSNLVLVKGWFEDTLPRFLSQHPGPARFVHVDCDLYSSAATVLTQLAPRILPGTIILFDEYFNYPGWEHHEYKAFKEFCSTFRRDYEYLGYASAHYSVAVRIQQSS